MDNNIFQRYFDKPREFIEDLVGITLNIFQVDFLNTINSSNNIVTIQDVNSGKTTIEVAYLLYANFLLDFKIIHVSSNPSQIKEYVGFYADKWNINSNGVDIVHINDIHSVEGKYDVVIVGDIWDTDKFEIRKIKKLRNRLGQIIISTSYNKDVEKFAISKENCNGWKYIKQYPRTKLGSPITINTVSSKVDMEQLKVIARKNIFRERNSMNDVTFLDAIKSNSIQDWKSVNEVVFLNDDDIKQEFIKTKILPEIEMYRSHLRQLLLSIDRLTAQEFK